MSTRQERRAEAIKKRKYEQRHIQERYKRQKMQKRLFIALGGLAVAAIIGWIGYAIYQNQQDQQLLGDVQSFDGLAATHVQEPVTYEQTPPVGGPHFNAWQNCGYYPVPLIDEHAVHSLEHGAVWITYQQDLPTEQVNIIRDRAENQTYVLASPYPDLTAPVVASAWGLQLQLESADDPALDAFLRTYRQGSQTLEPGALCTGGTSATQ
ncbi:MAG: DUF3105 domain-containing protein [Chloroflexia bacterium]|jgi:hypothetical protein|nr:DUF3105 domain-containing protein [Chloroflexia bacterium]